MRKDYIEDRIGLPVLLLLIEMLEPTRELLELQILSFSSYLEYLTV